MIHAIYLAYLWLMAFCNLTCKQINQLSFTFLAPKCLKTLPEMGLDTIDSFQGTNPVIASRVIKLFTSHVSMQERHYSTRAMKSPTRVEPWHERHLRTAMPSTG